MYPREELLASAKQKGFLIPFAAIIILGIAILALTIGRLASQGGQSSFLEGVSAQAFYAAESGAYFGLNRVLFDVNDSATADVNCVNLGGTTLTLNATGLENCSVSMACRIDTSAADSTHQYTVVSSAQCGAGDVFSERIVEVSAQL